MNPKQLWLFKHQRKRLLSLNHDFIMKEVDGVNNGRNVVEMLDWKASDLRDLDLLEGVMSAVPLPDYTPDEKHVSFGQPEVILQK